MRSTHSSRLAAIALIGAGVLSGTQPAFPTYTSGVKVDPYARQRSKRPSKYPFSSERQDARRYETVVGRNGHATMRRVA